MSKSISETYDVAIIGGGINGAVSAARLAASGIKVLLVEKNDFASTTSQESSNLVWGGIKYLQSYEFSLVYKLCASRNELLREYPNRIRQIGFLASLGPTAPFGKFLGLLGTTLYWTIGKFATNPPKVFSAMRAQQIEPAFLPGRAALEYFDAYLPDNDSRFVWEFISTAKQLGADCRNYQQLEGASFDGLWNLEIRGTLTGEASTARAKVLINATGPFANQLSNLLELKTRSQLVLSKGVHLVVPKIHKTDHVLAFWDEQGRMFYVIPMHDRSVIGTTDTRVGNETKEVTEEDREFLLRQINKEMNLERPLTKDDILAERCGVRPLVTSSNGAAEPDWHKLSRKHAVELDAKRKAISIFGGKLTDCLNVGEEVIAEVEKLGVKAKSNKSQKWFGEESAAAKAKFVQRASSVLANASEAELVIESLWRRHGSEALSILDLIEAQPESADSVFDGLGITFAEIDYVLRNEDVQTPEDLLRRRLPIAMSRSKAEIESNQRLNVVLGQLH
ncbi:MAG: FAD-dependent oxidoreductase [Micrococcales bacterium]